MGWVLRWPPAAVAATAAAVLIDMGGPGTSSKCAVPLQIDSRNRHASSQIFLIDMD